MSARRKQPALPAARGAEVSRRRLLQGAAGGSAAVAAGTLGVPWLAGESKAGGPDELIPWRGPRQAGIVTPRTDHAFIAAFNIVDDDLPRLFQDLTGRVSELTRGYPDRLDDIDNDALPPSDTGELGYDRRRDGRLTTTIGLGASLFDKRFGLRGRRPRALKRMPAFPVDNLDPDRSHGDLVLLAQAEHPMICHHAIRDVLRRTKGRLQGRWGQACFQRADPRKVERPGIAAARGLLGFPDGSQNISPEDDARIFTGAEEVDWARGGSYLAARLIRLKLERWDRLSKTAQEDSMGREKITGAPLEGGREQDIPKLGEETPRDAHIRLANPRGPGDEQRRFLRRGFVYTGGFDDYGLLDSGSVFLAFCRDVQEQFEHSKRGMIGQDLDEYAVAFGGGYFYCPPGVRGRGDYLARELVER